MPENILLRRTDGSFALRKRCDSSSCEESLDIETSSNIKSSASAKYASPVWGSERKRVSEIIQKTRNSFSKLLDTFLGGGNICSLYYLIHTPSSSHALHHDFNCNISIILPIIIIL